MTTIFAPHVNVTTPKESCPLRESFIEMGKVKLKVKTREDHVK